MDRFQRAVALAWPVAPVVLGAMMLATAWGRWPVSLAFAAAAAVPMLLLHAVVRWGVSRWAATAVLVVLLLLGAYAMTSGAGLGPVQTLRDAVPRLLTSPQPYAARGDLLVGPLLLVALVSTAVGLRLDSRLRVEPVVGGAVLYVAGALVTAGAGDPWGLVAVLLVAVSVLGWVFLDEHGEPARQRVPVAAPLTVVAVGVLAAVAVLPVREPFEPRGLVDPPVVEVVASSPLPQLGAWGANPDVELFSVRGDAVPLRLVTLDEYDGRQWSAATEFTEIGNLEGPEPPLGDATTSYRVDVELGRIGGTWLPSPGRPTSLALDGALVDPGTGTLYDADATEGLGYGVTGVVDTPSEEALAGATVPDRSEIGRYLELPPLSDGLAEVAERVVAGVVTPYDRAVAIESAVLGAARYAPDAVSGSALYRIESFLAPRGTEDAGPGTGEGTAEQFATTFAILARANGLPTRLVVGFAPGTDQEDGSRVVTGADATAWPEVYFADLGWVPFSPVPNDDTFRRSGDDGVGEGGPTEAPSSGSTDQAGTDVPSPSADAGGPVDEGDAGRGTSAVDGTVPVLVGAVAVVVLALLGLALARALRSARHRRRGAVGAWAEVVDALRLSGAPPPSHEPADLVAVAADARWGTDRAEPLAVRAEAAAFAPSAGSGGEAATTAGDDRAAMRADVRLLQRAARRHLPWWRRWWWHLDPRVLRRRGQGAVTRR